MRQICKIARLYSWRLLLKIAGKIDLLQEQFPDLNVTEIATHDPSDGNKYLTWMTKQLSLGAEEIDLYPLIERFHKNIQRLNKKDIYQYQDLEELDLAIKIIPEKSKREEKKELKKQEAQFEELHEGDKYILVRPDNKKACMNLGVDTNWCITMSNEPYYEKYVGGNIIFYFLISKDPTGSPLDKVAFSVKRDLDNQVEDIEIWDKNNRIYRKADNIEKYLPPGTIERIKEDAPLQPTGVLTKLFDNELSDQEMLAVHNLFGSRYVSVAVWQKISPEYRPEVMMTTKDGAVKAQMAEQVAPEHLIKLIKDEAPDVRLAVAKNIDPKYLPQLMNDSFDSVRIYVADRIDQKYLPEMMNDKVGIVRQFVAEGIAEEYLSQMANDPSKSVREIVQKRVEQAA